jgi:hypothetical protein
MQCEKTASQLLFNLETIVTDPEPESFGVFRIRIRNYLYGSGAGFFHLQAKS